MAEQCGRCNRQITGKPVRYTLRNPDGFKYSLLLHKSCAIAFADVLLRDSSKHGGIFGTEVRTRRTLDALGNGLIP